MATLWDKITTWVKQEAQDVQVVLSADEQKLLQLVKPLFGQAEAAAVQDLVVFIRGVLTQVQNLGETTLPDLETTVLNALQKLGSELVPVATGLGSNVLQALIGLILATLPAA